MTDGRIRRLSLINLRRQIIEGKLIETLMRTAIEFAGAGQGLLTLALDDEYRVEAEVTTSNDTVTVGQRQPGVTAAGLPESIPHYAMRTKESVLLHDVADGDLQEREARIRRLVDSNIIGIFVWDLEDRIIDANDAFLRIVGYDRDDLISGRLHWRDLTPTEWRDADDRRVAALKITGTAQPYEKEYFLKSGGRVPVLVGAATFGGRHDKGMAFVVDLTERKRAEEEIRESERRYNEVQMELVHANRVATIGQLSASIAHEVNQPIGATLNNASAALHWLNKEPADLEKARQALNRIFANGNRASEVIGRMRALFKKAPLRKEDVDINGAILEVIALTHGEVVKNGISVQSHLVDGLPLVQGDRVQLQQVIMNLIINAVEALSSLSEGSRELVITTGKGEPDGVLVVVRDSGPGLSSAGVDRIFEAFYTTKPGGLGMGLSICRTIIEAHGGRLWATADQPQGATFQLTLPAQSNQAACILQRANSGADGYRRYES
jgi:PAS domain S-box-containing protein